MTIPCSNCWVPDRLLCVSRLPLRLAIISVKLATAQNVNTNILPFDRSSENLEFYFGKITEVQSINGWDERTAFVFLKSKLTGNAFRFWVEDPDFKFQIPAWIPATVAKETGPVSY